MSDASATSRPVLNLRERRVLGVLVEKAKTTPDGYPLSLNALVTGCNQKSNRDPVLSLNEDEVEETLEALQKQGLVSKVTGSRVDRWRHHCRSDARTISKRFDWRDHHRRRPLHFSVSRLAVFLRWTGVDRHRHGSAEAECERSRGISVRRRRYPT